jgi:hypothetical protein
MTDHRCQLGNCARPATFDFRCASCSTPFASCIKHERPVRALLELHAARHAMVSQVVAIAQAEARP